MADKDKMCDFCANICELKKIEKGFFKGGYYPDKNKTQIVHDRKGYHIFFGCSDPFYADTEIENIKYCPICGRDLSDEV